jgi:hypothetical protein
MRRTVRHSREPRRVLCTPERQSDRYGWLHRVRMRARNPRRTAALLRTNMRSATLRDQLAERSVGVMHERMFLG